jgi:uncharacterized membrane-anchored protein
MTRFRKWLNRGDYVQTRLKGIAVGVAVLSVAWFVLTLVGGFLRGLTG